MLNKNGLGIDRLNNPNITASHSQYKLFLFLAFYLKGNHDLVLK